MTVGVAYAAECGFEEDSRGAELRRDEGGKHEPAAVVVSDRRHPLHRHLEALDGIDGIGIAATCPSNARSGALTSLRVRRRTHKLKRQAAHSQAEAPGALTS